MLNQIDEEVAAAGGRLYLAKDSRQSAGMMKNSYVRLYDWEQSVALINQTPKTFSDIAERLFNVPMA